MRFLSNQDYPQSRHLLTIQIGTISAQERFYANIKNPRLQMAVFLWGKFLVYGRGKFAA